jgi:hypothetical protein
MMESLGDILKRTPAPKSTAEDMATSSRDKDIEETSDNECPYARGRAGCALTYPSDILTLAK